MMILNFNFFFFLPRWNPTECYDQGQYTARIWAATMAFSVMAPDLMKKIIENVIAMLKVYL